MQNVGVLAGVEEAEKFVVWWVGGVGRGGVVVVQTSFRVQL